jgi:isoleucyl-tRNA synthetase
MLHKIYVLNSNFKNYFKNYDFHNLYKELLNFCTVDLSAFYFDIRKDTLYCDPIDSKKRQSTIILLNVILNSLLRWFAPILSFTTEEIYKLIYNNNNSIHLESFLNYPEKFKNDQLNQKWIDLIKIRNICNISIEEKRATKEIGSSLEAKLKINLDKRLSEITENVDFSELCITSSSEVIYNENIETSAETTKAKGTKCPVCWKITEEACPRHSE